jgi:hypothetical protein
MQDSRSHGTSADSESFQYSKYTHPNIGMLGAELEALLGEWD